MTTNRPILTREEEILEDVKKAMESLATQDEEIKKEIKELRTKTVEDINWPTHSSVLVENLCAEISSNILDEILKEIAEEKDTQSINTTSSLESLSDPKYSYRYNPELNKNNKHSNINNNNIDSNNESLVFAKKPPIQQYEESYTRFTTCYHPDFLKTFICKLLSYQGPESLLKKYITFCILQGFNNNHFLISENFYHDIAYLNEKFFYWIAFANFFKDYQNSPPAIMLADIIEETLNILKEKFEDASEPSKEIAKTIENTSEVLQINFKTCIPIHEIELEGLDRLIDKTKKLPNNEIFNNILQTLQEFKLQEFKKNIQEYDQKYKFLMPKLIFMEKNLISHLKLRNCYNNEVKFDALMDSLIESFKTITPPNESVYSKKVINSLLTKSESIKPYRKNSDSNLPRPTARNSVSNIGEIISPRGSRGFSAKDHNSVPFLFRSDAKTEVSSILVKSFSTLFSNNNNSDNKNSNEQKLKHSKELTEELLIKNNMVQNQPLYSSSLPPALPSTEIKVKNERRVSFSSLSKALKNLAPSKEVSYETNLIVNNSAQIKTFIENKNSIYISTPNSGTSSEIPSSPASPETPNLEINAQSELKKNNKTVSLPSLPNIFSSSNIKLANKEAIEHHQSLDSSLLHKAKISNNNNSKK